MNFGVIEDCNFIMSYCELVNKIKAEPLKYIDEYNLLYLRNYLDGYYYFKKYNVFFDDLLIFGDYCFNYFIQNKVMKIENSLAKKIDCLGSRNWESYIPLVETDPEKQFDFFFECFDEFKTLALADYDFTPLVRRFDKCDRDTYKLSLIKIKETNIKTDFLQFITIHITINIISTNHVIKNVSPICLLNKKPDTAKINVINIYLPVLITPPKQIFLICSFVYSLKFDFTYVFDCIL